MSILETKLENAYQACIELGFFNIREITLGLRQKNCATIEKLLCCLYHIYNNHDHGNDTVWKINEEGLLTFFNPLNDPDRSSIGRPWYIYMKSKWNFLLSPLPVFDEGSGCYQIVENKEVVATVPPHI